MPIDVHQAWYYLLGMALTKPESPIFAKTGLWMLGTGPGLERGFRRNDRLTPSGSLSGPNGRLILSHFVYYGLLVLSFNYLCLLISIFRVKGTSSTWSISSSYISLKTKHVNRTQRYEISFMLKSHPILILTLNKITDPVS